jgi:hypothetical protein
MDSISKSLAHGESEPSGQVIFSYVDGFVWASWPGAVCMVRVGEYQMVTAAMEDFLAQRDVADRLLNRASSTPSGC